jgi:hypothetical protein
MEEASAVTAAEALVADLVVSVAEAAAVLAAAEQAGVGNGSMVERQC